MFFFFQAEDGIRDLTVTGVQTCALPIFPSVPMAQAGPMFANRPLGQLSPRDTARATIGGAEVWIDYSRPSRRGRDIFGALEPWNKVWRTGANAATQLNTTADLVIGGATGPAGDSTHFRLVAT